MSDQMMSLNEAVVYIARVTGRSSKGALDSLKEAISAGLITYHLGHDGVVQTVSRFDVLRTWPEAYIKEAARALEPAGNWMTWGYAVDFVAAALKTTDGIAGAMLGGWVEEGVIGYELPGTLMFHAKYPFSSWVAGLTAAQQPIVDKSDVMKKLAVTPAQPAAPSVIAATENITDRQAGLRELLAMRVKIRAILAEDLRCAGEVPDLARYDALADKILVEIVK